MGINGGTRVGTKTAISDEKLEAAIAKALQQKRPGMASLLSLERCLGLRGVEAIHAQSDTLIRWEDLLRNGSPIEVIAGAKGGKRRTVNVKNLQRAIDALQVARQVADAQGGFLVLRANGCPAGGLKQARRIYHSWSHRAGLQPHAARYAFAQDQYEAYLGEGYSPREALIAVSHDLGHGDGRGRWVKSVYMR